MTTRCVVDAGGIVGAAPRSCLGEVDLQAPQQRAMVGLGREALGRGAGGSRTGTGGACSSGQPLREVGRVGLDEHRLDRRLRQVGDQRDAAA